MIVYIRFFIIFFVTVQEHDPKPSEARSVLKRRVADLDATLFKTDLASEGFGLCSWTVTRKIIKAGM